MDVKLDKDQQHLKQDVEELDNIIEYDDIKLDYKIVSLLKEKREQFENEFIKNFRFVTSSIDFKNRLFYQRVKVIIENCKILVFDYKSNNLYDPSEVYSPLLNLDFNQVTASIVLDKDVNKSMQKNDSNYFSFRIFVLGYPKSFKFSTGSKEIFETALIHLNYFINISAGKKINLLGISLRANFDKVNF